ncbi:MAG: diguanylate cyclase [Rhodanobacteraceae bacterium]
MDAFRSFAPSSGEQAASFIARVHVLRIIGLALGFLVIAPVLYANGASLAKWTLLVLCGFAWPHIARSLAERGASARLAESRNLMVDSILGGVWIALMHFNLLPSMVLVTMLAMGNIVVGGRKLLLRGLALQILACVLVSPVEGFAFSLQTTLFEMLATIPFLVFYPTAVGATMYQLTQRVRRQNKLLTQAGSIDSLSDLLNRASWEQAVCSVLDSHTRSERSASLLMIDIDHFKGVNDRYGHTVGDEVIRRIGAVIRRCLRECDVAGRYGGDEFGIVLSGADAATAGAIAERIRAGVAAAGFEHAADLCCTLSIGIAQISHDTCSARDWVAQADAAMYGAKLAGRNRLAAA